MFEKIAINVISALATTAIITLVGYIFRNKIRKALKGVDLLALNNVPEIEFADRQYVTDLNNNKMAHFLISNCGHINITKIRMFKCCMKDAGHPTSLAIIKLPYERQFTNINHNNGEVMQIGIDTRFLEINESYPETRLLIELSSEDGSCFRATVIPTSKAHLIIPGTDFFSVSLIGRVRKPLPSRKIKANNPRRIKRVRKRYDLDIAVG